MTEVEITMIGPKVLVAPEDQKEHRAASGVIMIEHYAPEVIGRVVSVGPLVRDVQPDDVVMFTAQAGTEMDFGGRKYLIMDEDEILLIWDGDQEPV